MIDDPDSCYEAVRSRDARFDGCFTFTVTSTGIYCRPSCPARTPKRANVCFHATAAAAQQAGFRACRRCRPDAVPGSPAWDLRADLVGRALHLIADGVVDRECVTGLASRLGYAERHLYRQLVAAVGAGPLALARAQRARTARTLAESSVLPLTKIAFAAGFTSVRQFNDTVRAVYATTPSQLRRTAGRRRSDLPTAATTGATVVGPTAATTGATVVGPTAGSRPAVGAGGHEAAPLALRLPHRVPGDTAGVLAFLAARAVPGVEESLPRGGLRRSLRLPHGPAVVELVPADGHVRAFGDPDAFPDGDLGLRRAWQHLGGPGDLAARAERWRPWRAYAAVRLWDVPAPQTPRRVRTTSGSPRTPRRKHRVDIGQDHPVHPDRTADPRQ